jgi:hypothetical protein
MKRDVNLMKKRGKDISKLAVALSLLASGEPLPPNLFAQTTSLERERLKEAYRRYYVETMGKWEEIAYENKLAEIVAESISECISEELLNPWLDDWD